MSYFIRELSPNNQFIIGIKVIKCPTLEQYDDGTAQELMTHAKLRRALVDTGATQTSIVQELADELDLIPLSQSTIMTAGSPCEAYQYQVDLAIPVTETVLQPSEKEGEAKIISIEEEYWAHVQREVGSLPSIDEDRGFDALLGMDILSKMHITMVDEKIIMSF